MTIIGLLADLQGAEAVRPADGGGRVEVSAVTTSAGNIRNLRAGHAADQGQVFRRTGAGLQSLAMGDRQTPVRSSCAPARIQTEKECPCQAAAWATVLIWPSASIPASVTHSKWSRTRGAVACGKLRSAQGCQLIGVAALGETQLLCLRENRCGFALQ